MKKATRMIVVGKWKRQGIGLFLITLFLIMLSQTLFAQSEQEIRDGVLGRIPADVAAMDSNHDGKVDVADLVKYVKENGITTPVVSFEQADSMVSEGDGTVLVKVNVSTNFSGTLRYTVEGTADAGSDYQTLSGSVTVNGVYVEIPVMIVDDNLLENPAEMIVLSIYYEDQQGLAYIPGGFTEHTIFITDNDAFWNGVIEQNGTAVHFQMNIARSPAGTSAALVTDGYGIIPKNGDSSEWPAQNVTFTGAAFRATVPGIVVPSELTLTEAEFTRKLIFEANAALEGHTVAPDAEIRGTVQEVVTCPAARQFEYTSVGTFTLLKQIPNIEPQQPRLIPVP